MMRRLGGKVCRTHANDASGVEVYNDRTAAAMPSFDNAAPNDQPRSQEQKEKLR